MKKIAISLSTIVLLFATSYYKSVEVTGVRKADVNKDSQNLPIVKYNDQAPIPGKVEPMKQAFPDAPPMIPHSVEGMVPITIKNNMCLNCHMPNTAKALNVTPLPKDHLKTSTQVKGSRYFCTTCHTPQAKLNPVIENKFESLKKRW